MIWYCGKPISDDELKDRVMELEDELKTTKDLVKELRDQVYGKYRNCYLISTKNPEGETIHGRINLLLDYFNLEVKREEVHTHLEEKKSVTKDKKKSS